MELCNCSFRCLLSVFTAVVKPCWNINFPDVLQPYARLYEDSEVRGFERQSVFIGWFHVWSVLDLSLHPAHTLLHSNKGSKVQLANSNMQRMGEKAEKKVREAKKEG